jgi:hypothetical protein
VRIIGLLSWYDEAPSWLAATVTAAAPMLDHLVAVDGAYALYPDGRARSEPGQAETILRTCDAAGIGLTLHAPQHRWEGNETGKRTYAFGLACAEAEPDVDWIIVIDGDDVVSHIPGDIRPRLKATERNVAEVTLWDREAWIEKTPEAAQGLPLPPITKQRQRRLYRAADEIKVVGSHFVYTARRGDADWSYLWGPNTFPLEPAADFSDLEIEHRSRHRDRARREAAGEYYRIRDALGIENTGRRMMETVEGGKELV